MRTVSVAKVALLVLGVLGTRLDATAALFIVDTSLVDLGDIDPGNGVCAWATFPPVGQRCTLRAAVAEANALAGDDVVLIPAGMTIVLENGEIDIASNMIVGSLEDGDERPIVDANYESRIFEVGFANTSVTIGNLVIRRGRALGGNSNNTGGAITAGPGNYELAIIGCDLLENGAGGGGALHTLNSELRIVDSTFIDNFVADPAADVNPFGSAVWVANGSATSIEGSTFAMNFSLRTNGGPAIKAQTSELEIRNSTIDWNFGGVSSPTPEISIANSTISDNYEFGIELDGAGSVSFSIRDSIVANNDVAVGCSIDVGGIIFTSASYSLDEDSSCGFVPGSGNLIGVDPLLGPLADNGGPTRTRRPQAGSPAIDAGNPATPGTAGACLAIDQRGVARPQPGTPTATPRCDMGAVEVPEPAALALALASLGALVGRAMVRSS